MQKQDTQSFFTSATKNDENTPQIALNGNLLNLGNDCHHEHKIELPSSIANSDDEERSRQQSDGRTIKKCFNQRCSNTQIFRKVKSRVEKNKYRFLCEKCHESYINLQFCQFCEQIYGTDDQDQDGSNWVGCDNCERWNHITCEISARGFDFKTLQDQQSRYCCLKCLNDQNANKLRLGLRARPESLQKEYRKQKCTRQGQPSLMECQKISMTWCKQQFYHLQHFLNNLSRGQSIPHSQDFKLCLSDELIKYDINRLKNDGTPRFSIKNKN